jgi:hypothetical protein
MLLLASPSGSSPRIINRQPRWIVDQPQKRRTAKPGFHRPAKIDALIHLTNLFLHRNFLRCSTLCLFDQRNEAFISQRHRTWSLYAKKSTDAP